MQKIKYILVILTLATVQSCVSPQGHSALYYGSPSTPAGYNANAPLSGGYYNGGSTCVRNPYLYAIDPYNWQMWEKNNYYVSCTTQGGYAY